MQRTQANNEHFSGKLQGRSWFITINCTNGEEQFDIAKQNCIFAVGQIEVGEKTNREHIHILAHFQSNHRFKAVKKLWPKADIEYPRNVANCIEYCQKERTRIRGPFEFGVSPIDMVKANFKFTVEKAKKMSEEELQELSCQNYISVKKAIQLIPTEATESDNVRGLWLYGPPGSGKSRKAFNDYPSAYIKQQNNWFCGYNGESVILLDDLDCIGNKEMGHNLKRWADRYKVTAQKKFGQTGLRHDLFVVTSNYVPTQLYPDDPVLAEAVARRFKFVHIPKLMPP